MNTDTLKSIGNEFGQIDKDQFLSTALSSDKFNNIKDILSSNSGSGWLGTSEAEIQTSLDSSGCDCSDCCGDIAPDSEFNSLGNNLVPGNDFASIDTPVFANASQEAVTTSVKLSGNKDIDALLYPAKWTTNTITYSFFDGGKYYGSEGNVKPVTEKMKGYLRNILESFERYVPLNFVEVSDAGNDFGQIRYMFSNGPSTAYTKVPYKYQDSRNDRYKGGDIHFSPGSKSEFDKGPGAYRHETLVHETLHALNMKHPGNYNGSSNGNQSGKFLSFADDNSNNSILSYNRLRNTRNYSGTLTPMAYDIRAMQYLYGAAEYNGGDTTYKFAAVDKYSANGEFFGNPNDNAKQSVWDSGGNDTFDFSELGSNKSGYRFDLREGGVITTQNAYLDTQYEARGSGGKKYKATSTGTFLTYNTTFENVINSRSDDYMIANGGANKFGGYSVGKKTGNDVIVKSNGQDTLDLSGYKASDFTTNASGKDLIVDLKSNGSITVQDYYKAAAGDRIKILTAGGNPDPNPDPTPTNGKLVWEEQGLTDENAVATGSKFDLGNGVNATVNWQIVTDGGNFVPSGGKDFVSYESGKSGNHTGYLSLGFDNSKDDPDDLIKVSLDFNKSVAGLNFKLLDVDQGAGKKFDDGVEIYADGVNIKNISGVDILPGGNVMADNEPYMNGFEGRGTSGANSSSEGGNIEISFGSTEVSTLEVKYFSTDDAISNPGSQKIGISDLSFQSA